MYVNIMLKYIRFLAFLHHGLPLEDKPIDSIPMYTRVSFPFINIGSPWLTSVTKKFHKRIENNAKQQSITNSFFFFSNSC